MSGSKSSGSIRGKGSTLNGRYRVAELIGEGGMAEVHRAEDALLERSVAVKILRPQYATDPEFLARFQQEARFAARLTHPNIASTYDVGSDGTTHYIVMEYVDGRSLKAAIEAGGPIPVAQAVDIAIQILSALSFAHQKGLVHRDVKPQNVLLGPDGQVKVVDFGIARAAKGSQTTTGIVLATVQYGSPEQLSGQPATESSDIYSLGVVLYEMLTGRLPFDAESSVAVALKHVQSPPPPPRKVNPAIPPALEAIVMKALAKTPAERFASAGEMRRALRSYQDGDQRTATFRPVVRATGDTSVLQATRGAVTSQRRGGIDWLAVVLGLMVFVLVAGAVPFGMRLFNQYAGQQSTATQTPQAIVLASPTPTPTATPTPPRSTATPTSAPSPTSSPLPDVVVPRLIELRFDQAQKAVDALGLKIRLAGEEFSPVYPAGIITNQSPTPDKKLVAGGTIDVTVSKGPEQVLVTSVVGYPLADAKAALEADGFRVKSSEKYHEQVPVGIVLEQSPGAMQLAAKGSEISLIVSRGPAPTPIPSPTTRPSPTPTKAPTPTPSPSPTATKVPTPIVSLSGVPVSGDTVNQNLVANQMLMLVGNQITYGAFTCPAQATRICVLIVGVTKTTSVTVAGLTTGANWLGVWSGVGSDAALSQQSPSFWRAPNCTTGCVVGTVGIFLDNKLVEQRTIGK